MKTSSATRVLGALVCSLTIFAPVFGQADTTNHHGILRSEFEPFPILSYDTDVGLGYGAKLFAVNYVGSNESFDLTAFNSTKGERWYRLMISFPDFERRQGTTYLLAVDLLIDYDKLIAATFFGIGPHSKFSEREIYTKEPLELSLTFSRGFSESLVGQAGIRFKAVRNFNFSFGSRLQTLLPALNASRASAASAFTIVRYDTRNSYINATKGEVVQVEGEWAPASQLGSVAFSRLAWWGQIYRPILSPFVMAARIGVSTISGDDVPVQMLIPIGGGWTLRGYPQDRFLSMAGVVVNLEARFPVIWRFGGIVGGDAGGVWDRIGAFGLKGWKMDGVVGIRFFMDTFVVRLDVGFGSETTGLYLNFGQLF